ncbi:hypothetical protein BDP81DRAFT_422340 [Colletotrichum phormii]|uniref:Uncharacterized protein n=1 Tax=Colletotrichum phormii TaxID=359342 RepID=A0AAJ0EGY4_9PEZI|nr:uncharacterized protein BDP81DRAFT_422340 [Colletotrichum phormii]KAK1638618.1 hypothetical protein BDP81DRAFT_422340 [Colletotrichum phormii]
MSVTLPASISNQMFFSFPQAPFLAMPLIQSSDSTRVTRRGTTNIFLEETEQALTEIGASREETGRFLRVHALAQPRPTAGLGPLLSDTMRSDRWPGTCTFTCTHALAVSGVLFSANFSVLSFCSWTLVPIIVYFSRSSVCVHQVEDSYKGKHTRYQVVLETIATWRVQSTGSRYPDSLFLMTSS